MRLYVDGGVVKKNPSPIGGTWAWCLIDNDEIVLSGCGSILPTPGFPGISNNYSEMVALLEGLESTRSMWSPQFRVFSDSQVTLNRVFGNWRWSNLPETLEMRYLRLQQDPKFRDLECFLLHGHPSKKELEIGFKRGLPVSKWNVWCDRECTKVSLALQALSLASGGI